MNHKAGLIPYYKDNDEIRMLFMVSSDPDYGGPDPQVAKGEVDAGEEIADAAVREAQEELGFNTYNAVPNTFARAWEDVITGKFDRFYLTVYCVEVQDPDNFSEPHYETARTVWMTLDEFEGQGRRVQIPVVEAVASLAQDAQTRL